MFLRFVCLRFGMADWPGGRCWWLGLVRWRWGFGLVCWRWGFGLVCWRWGDWRAIIG